MGNKASFAHIAVSDKYTPGLFITDFFVTDTKSERPKILPKLNDTKFGCWKKSKRDDRSAISRRNVSFTEIRVSKQLSDCRNQRTIALKLTSTPSHGLSNMSNISWFILQAMKWSVSGKTNLETTKNIWNKETIKRMKWRNNNEVNFNSSAWKKGG